MKTKRQETQGRKEELNLNAATIIAGIAGIAGRQHEDIRPEHEGRCIPSGNGYCSLCFLEEKGVL